MFTIHQLDPLVVEVDEAQENQAAPLLFIDKRFTAASFRRYLTSSEHSCSLRMSHLCHLAQVLQSIVPPGRRWNGATGSRKGLMMGKQK